jgi:hypothetical protein
MPRYLVERSFPEGLAIPVDEGGAKACQVVVDRITEVRVLDPYFYR